MDRLPRGCTAERNGIRIRVRRRGIRYTETLCGDPRSQALRRRARARYEEIVERIRLGLPLEESAGTLEDAALSWLQSAQIDADTRQRYANIMDRHWSHLYQMPPQTITAAHVKAHLAGCGLTVKSQKNVYSVLRLALMHAGIAPPPIQWPKKLRQTQRHRIERFTPEQRTAVIQALQSLHRDAVAHHASHPRERYRAHWTGVAARFYPLLFATGLRPGEALALKPDDWSDPLLHVHATHTRNVRKESTKTGVSRRVYVPEWGRQYLVLPFRNSQGGHLTDSKRIVPIWREALTMCGLPDRDPYVCRHTRAAELLSTGVNHAEAAQQLGHSVQMFLGLYSEWIDEYAGRRDYSHLEGIGHSLAEHDAEKAPKPLK